MSDNDSAEKHLHDCLDTSETASGFKFAYGVRKAIADDRREAFYRNEPRWPSVGHKVLHSAVFVGRFARLFAEFDGETELREIDMRKALKAVKDICDARLLAEGVPSQKIDRLEWCA